MPVNIKTTFLLLQSYKIAIFAGAFAVLLSKRNDHSVGFLVTESFLTAVFTLSILSRVALAPLLLRTSKDPDLLYALLSKLDRRSLWLVRKRPAKPYTPLLPEDQFLTDNGLSTDIFYDKATEKRIMVFMTIVVLVLNGVVLYARINPLPGLIPLAILVIFWLVLRRKDKKTDPGPQVSFSNSGLRVYKEDIPWKNVRDWEYYPQQNGASRQASKMVVEHDGPDMGKSTTDLHLHALGASRVELALLLVYFKGKYGK